MKNLSELRGWNTTYLIYCLVFALFLSFYCVLFSKGEGFLFINQFHFRILDGFFVLFTNLGNGLFVIGLMVIMMTRKKIGWSMQTGISFLVSGLVVQLFKHLMHSPRPRVYFGPNEIRYIHGVTGTGYSSFPSGHTATIFALTTLLSFYFPGRRNGILFFLIAALTGFSRIYLSQHFPIDILGGLLTGVLTSIAVYMYLPLARFDKKFTKDEFESQSTNLQ
jgi:membrane-associated phospholipid phosphatase